MTSLTAEHWRVNGYVVADYLGRGGFGEVWSGRVKSTGRAVALKRITATDAAERKAARIEAAVMSALEHPNLVALHDFVSARGHFVLVMDLAGQGSLRELLDRRGRITSGEVSHMMSAVAGAVAYAHNVGVIHGDITPGNILFNSLGIPLLGDLGVARIVGEFAPIVATAAYIDPAVAAGAPPGKPSDVFMLAATAFHALTGEPLWAGTDDVAVRAARSAQEGFAHTRLAAVDSPLMPVIERALSPDPRLRPTASGFALDLRASCDPVPVDLDVGRVVSPVSSSAGMSPRVAGAHRRPPATPVPAVTRAAHPTLPAVPVGRWRRIAATVRYRPRALLRLVVVAAAIVGLSAWLAQLVSPSSSSGPATAAGAAPAPAASPMWSPTPAPAASPMWSPIPAPASTAPSSSSAPATTVSDIGAVLDRIDALRQQAYAANDPSRLAEVYLPGNLLEQDISTMARLVPAGCGLHGVHTSYADPRQEVTADGGLSVVVVATLAPSTLRCQNQMTKEFSGHPATRLRLVLVNDGTNYRLSAQQVL